MMPGRPAKNRAKIFPGKSFERSLTFEDYRIFYEIYEDTLVILVLKIGHRREIYRRLV
jgi:mRNA interferase RelE/StbE